jgi:nicotinamide-nucleotide amidase
MRAEIISIGTEIMLGEITDTNASFIARELPQYGVDLLWVTQTGDNPGRMAEVFERAWGRSEIVFTTGGLGPTEDDITRETVAATLGEEMAIDDEQERILRAIMERGGRPMPERNLKQAMLIPSSRAIPNPRGTAPGWWVEREGRVFVVMPGPPAEMTRMWEHEISPELERRATSILVSRTLKTSGLGESTVDEMLSPLLSGTNPSIGVYHRADGVHARIAANAATREEAWRLI